MGPLDQWSILQGISEFPEVRVQPAMFLTRFINLWGGNSNPQSFNRTLKLVPGGSRSNQAARDRRSTRQRWCGTSSRTKWSSPWTWMTSRVRRSSSDEEQRILATTKCKDDKNVTESQTPIIIILCVRNHSSRLCLIKSYNLWSISPTFY